MGNPVSATVNSNGSNSQTWTGLHPTLNVKGPVQELTIEKTVVWENIIRVFIWSSNSVQPLRYCYKGLVLDLCHKRNPYRDELASLAHVSLVLAHLRVLLQIQNVFAFQLLFHCLKENSWLLSARTTMWSSLVAWSGFAESLANHIMNNDVMSRSQSITSYRSCVCRQYYSINNLLICNDE